MHVESITSSLITTMLSPAEYARYGRQLILPDFGRDAQERLKYARLLVIGAGGLGCPAIQYLAAAGVGTLPLTGHIAVVDNDVVEMNNLARQILHTESRIGMPKVHSIAESVRECVSVLTSINPLVHVEPICESFSAANAQSLVGRYDLVLDCTDNVMTRYLISDAAVLCDKPVVSAAAQGYDGQLVVLHKQLDNGLYGPCYRCLFPRPPRPEHTQSCEDGGVIGCITGLLGTMQATEAIKLISRVGSSASAPTMTFVSPFSPVPFRHVRIRPQQRTCRVCGDERNITNLTEEDYVSFCAIAPPESFFPAVRLAPEAIEMHHGSLVDVRPPHEYKLTHIPGSVNVPIDDVRRDAKGSLARLQGPHVTLICRRGNDSREAARLLGEVSDENWSFDDVEGGLRAYARAYPAFPMY